MDSADMCEHDWPGSGCKECRAERDRVRDEPYDSLIEEAITEHFGERCDEYEALCVVCRVWAEFDALNGEGDEYGDINDETVAWARDHGWRPE